MKRLLFIGVLFLISVKSFSESDNSAEFKALFLDGEVEFTMGNLTDQAKFKSIPNTDVLLVDKDLSRYNVTRVSPAFISVDGKYVFTFVKDSLNNIKRVLFVYDQGKSYTFADQFKGFKDGQLVSAEGKVSRLRK